MNSGESALPTFRYHPDPLGTGSIKPSAATCRACGRARGYIYAGLPYAEEELEGALCPWCIADGTAARRFAAVFVEREAVGGYGDWDQVPADIVDEITTRTPAFTGWQQERWWTHCGDGAEFLGHAGRHELETRWPDAIPAIRAEFAELGDMWNDYFKSLTADGSPTAYVFRCRHCGAFGGYSDFE